MMGMLTLKAKRGKLRNKKGTDPPEERALE
jgi:hypothetical protein